MILDGRSARCLCNPSVSRDYHDSFSLDTAVLACQDHSVHRRSANHRLFFLRLPGLAWPPSGRAATRHPPLLPVGPPDRRGNTLCPHARRQAKHRMHLAPLSLRPGDSLCAGRAGARAHHGRLLPERALLSHLPFLLGHYHRATTAGFLGEVDRHPVACLERPAGLLRLVAIRHRPLHGTQRRPVRRPADRTPRAVLCAAHPFPLVPPRGNPAYFLLCGGPCHPAALHA